jgi:oligoribonuclease
LCGNSIATDRSFLARDMPELDAFLHYRMVDVSSVKELARRWYPRAYFASPPKHGGHRALADITESIRELRYYREAVFVPPPGPDSGTARRIAARYSSQNGPVGPGQAGGRADTAARDGV